MRVLAAISLVIAGTVLTLPSTSLRASAQQPVSPKLRAEAELEALTERVEAISAIKRLQYAYGHYAELGLWHDFADLFADSGIGHYAQGNLDREGIRSLFLKEVGQGRLGLADGRIYPHISMQPVITLAADGQSAKGRWHIMALLGGYGTSASWAGGVYENEYVRENGVWKFKDVRYVQQYSGRYDDPGWKAGIEPVQPIVDSGLGPRGSGVGRQTRVEDLAERAARLSDEIEVTNLQHDYGYYVDRKRWDDVAALFAEDGTMEIGLQGVYAGRKSIRRGLNAFAPAEAGSHVHLETIVTVLPGGTARARGSDIGISGTILSQSIYENEFVKQGSVWKIKTMRVYPRFIVAAAKGWAKDAQPAPGPSREFPPDRPPTETYGIYPRFHIAPLHFSHPVTGRPPQYPEGMNAPSVVSAFRRTASAPVGTPAAIARSVERSLAYHAAENLISAYGYGLDDKSPKNVLTLHQIVQPVIHVSADAKNARIRARLFQLGNSAGGEGAWMSGIYDGASVDDGGAWKLSRIELSRISTTSSHGGQLR